MTSKIKIIYIIIVIVSAPFIFGTSPRPEPYNEYRVTGHIARQNGGPKENYIVSLLGRSSFNHPDTIFALRSSNGLDFGVTDSNGYFIIDVVTQKIDSITVVVSAADKASFISSKWFSPTGSITLYSLRSYDEPGCSGCGTETTTENSINGYIHTFQPQTVIIPN